MAGDSRSRALSTGSDDQSFFSMRSSMGSRRRSIGTPRAQQQDSQHSTAPVHQPVVHTSQTGLGPPSEMQSDAHSPLFRVHSPRREWKMMRSLQSSQKRSMPHADESMNHREQGARQQSVPQAQGSPRKGGSKGFTNLIPKSSFGWTSREKQSHQHQTTSPGVGAAEASFASRGGLLDRSGRGNVHAASVAPLEAALDSSDSENEILPFGPARSLSPPGAGLARMRSTETTSDEDNDDDEFLDSYRDAQNETQVIGVLADPDAVKEEWGDDFVLESDTLLDGNALSVTHAPSSTTGHAGSASLPLARQSGKRHDVTSLSATTSTSSLEALIHPVSKSLASSDPHSTDSLQDVARKILECLKSSKPSESLPSPRSSQLDKISLAPTDQDESRLSSLPFSHPVQEAAPEEAYSVRESSSVSPEDAATRNFGLVRAFSDIGDEVKRFVSMTLTRGSTALTGAHLGNDSSARIAHGALDTALIGPEPYGDARVFESLDIAAAGIGLDMFGDMAVESLCSFVSKHRIRLVSPSEFCSPAVYGHACSVHKPFLLEALANHATTAGESTRSEQDWNAERTFSNLIENECVERTHFLCELEHDDSIQCSSLDNMLTIFSWEICAARNLVLRDKCPRAARSTETGMSAAVSAFGHGRGLAAAHLLSESLTLKQSGLVDKARVVMVRALLEIAPSVPCLGVTDVSTKGESKAQCVFQPIERELMSRIDYKDVLTAVMLLWEFGLLERESSTDRVSQAVLYWRVGLALCSECWPQSSLERSRDARSTICQLDVEAHKIWSVALSRESEFQTRKDDTFVWPKFWSLNFSLALISTVMDAGQGEGAGLGSSLGMSPIPSPSPSRDAASVPLQFETAFKLGVSALHLIFGNLMIGMTEYGSDAAVSVSHVAPYPISKTIALLSKMTEAALQVGALHFGTRCSRWLFELGTALLNAPLQIAAAKTMDMFAAVMVLQRGLPSEESCSHSPVMLVERLRAARIRMSRGRDMNDAGNDEDDEDEDWDAEIEGELNVRISRYVDDLNLDFSFAAENTTGGSHELLSKTMGTRAMTGTDALVQNVGVLKLRPLEFESRAAIRRRLQNKKSRSLGGGVIQGTQTGGDVKQTLVSGFMIRDTFSASAFSHMLNTFVLSRGDRHTAGISDRSAMRHSRAEVHAERIMHGGAGLSSSSGAHDEARAVPEESVVDDSPKLRNQIQSVRPKDILSEFLEKSKSVSRPSLEWSALLLDTIHRIVYVPKVSDLELSQMETIMLSFFETTKRYARTVPILDENSLRNRQLLLAMSTLILWVARGFALRDARQYPAFRHMTDLHAQCCSSYVYARWLESVLISTTPSKSSHRISLDTTGPRDFRVCLEPECSVRDRSDSRVGFKSPARRRAERISICWEDTFQLVHVLNLLECEFSVGQSACKPIKWDFYFVDRIVSSLTSLSVIPRTATGDLVSPRAAPSSFAARAIHAENEKRNSIRESLLQISHAEQSTFVRLIHACAYARINLERFIAECKGEVDDFSGGPQLAQHADTFAEYMKRMHDEEQRRCGMRLSQETSMFEDFWAGLRRPVAGLDQTVTETPVWNALSGLPVIHQPLGVYTLILTTLYLASVNVDPSWLKTMDLEKAEIDFIDGKKKELFGRVKDHLETNLQSRHWPDRNRSTNPSAVTGSTFAGSPDDSSTISRKPSRSRWDRTSSFGRSFDAGNENGNKNANEDDMSGPALSGSLGSAPSASFSSSNEDALASFLPNLFSRKKSKRSKKLDDADPQRDLSGPAAVADGVAQAGMHMISPPRAGSTGDRAFRAEYDEVRRTLGWFETVLDEVAERDMFVIKQVISEIDFSAIIFQLGKLYPYISGGHLPHARVAIALAHYELNVLKRYAMAEKMLFDAVLIQMWLNGAFSEANYFSKSPYVDNPLLKKSIMTANHTLEGTPTILRLFGEVALENGKYEHAMAALSASLSRYEALTNRNDEYLEQLLHLVWIANSKSDWRRALLMLSTIAKHAKPKEGKRNSFMQYCFAVFSTCVNAGCFLAAETPVMALRSLLLEESKGTAGLNFPQVSVGSSASPGDSAFDASAAIPMKGYGLYFDLHGKGKKMTSLTGSGPSDVGVNVEDAERSGSNGESETYSVDRTLVDLFEAHLMLKSGKLFDCQKLLRHLLEHKLPYGLRLRALESYARVAYAMGQFHCCTDLCEEVQKESLTLRSFYANRSQNNYDTDGRYLDRKGVAFGNRATSGFGAMENGMDGRTGNDDAERRLSMDAFKQLQNTLIELRKRKSQLSQFFGGTASFSGPVRRHRQSQARMSTSETSPGNSTSASFSASFFLRSDDDDDDDDDDDGDDGNASNEGSLKRSTSMSAFNFSRWNSRSSKGPRSHRESGTFRRHASRALSEKSNEGATAVGPTRTVSSRSSFDLDGEQHHSHQDACHVDGVGDGAEIADSLMDEGGAAALESLLIPEIEFLRIKSLIKSEKYCPAAQALSDFVECLDESNLQYQARCSFLRGRILFELSRSSNPQSSFRGGGTCIHGVSDCPFTLHSEKESESPVDNVGFLVARSLRAFEEAERLYNTVGDEAHARKARSYWLKMALDWLFSQCVLRLRVPSANFGATESGSAQQESRRGGLAVNGKDHYDQGQTTGQKKAGVFAGSGHFTDGNDHNYREPLGPGHAGEEFMSLEEARVLVDSASRIRRVGLDLEYDSHSAPSPSAARDPFRIDLAVLDSTCVQLLNWYSVTDCDPLNVIDALTSMSEFRFLKSLEQERMQAKADQADRAASCVQKGYDPNVSHSQSPSQVESVESSVPRGQNLSTSSRGGKKSRENKHSVTTPTKRAPTQAWKEWLLIAWDHFKRMYVKLPSLRVLIVPCAPLGKLQRLKRLLGRMVRLLLFDQYATDGGPNGKSMEVHLQALEVYTTLQVDLWRRMNLAQEFDRNPSLHVAAGDDDLRDMLNLLASRNRAASSNSASHPDYGASRVGWLHRIRVAVSGDYEMAHGLNIPVESDRAPRKQPSGGAGAVVNFIGQESIELTKTGFRMLVLDSQKVLTSNIRTHLALLMADNPIEFNIVLRRSRDSDDSGARRKEDTFGATAMSLMTDPRTGLGFLLARLREHEKESEEDRVVEKAFMPLEHVVWSYVARLKVERERFAWGQLSLEEFRQRSNAIVSLWARSVGEALSSDLLIPRIQALHEEEQRQHHAELGKSASGGRADESSGASRGDAHAPTPFVSQEPTASSVCLPIWVSDGGADDQAKKRHSGGGKKSISISASRPSSAREKDERHSAGMYSPVEADAHVQEIDTNIAEIRGEAAKYSRSWYVPKKVREQLVFVVHAEGMLGYFAVHLGGCFRKFAFSGKNTVLRPHELIAVYTQGNKAKPAMNLDANNNVIGVTAPAKVVLPAPSSAAAAASSNSSYDDTFAFRKLQRAELEYLYSLVNENGIHRRVLQRGGASAAAFELDLNLDVFLANPYDEDEQDELSFEKKGGDLEKGRISLVAQPQSTTDAGWPDAGGEMLDGDVRMVSRMSSKHSDLTSMAQTAEKPSSRASNLRKTVSIGASRNVSTAPKSAGVPLSGAVDRLESRIKILRMLGNHFLMVPRNLQQMRKIGEEAVAGSNLPRKEASAAYKSDRMYFVIDAGLHALPWELLVNHTVIRSLTLEDACRAKRVDMSTAPQASGDASITRKNTTINLAGSKLNETPQARSYSKHSGGAHRDHVQVQSTVALRRDADVFGIICFGEAPRDDYESDMRLELLAEHSIANVSGEEPVDLTRKLGTYGSAFSFYPYSQQSQQRHIGPVTSPLFLSRREKREPKSLGVTLRDGKGAISGMFAFVRKSPGGAGIGGGGGGGMSLSDGMPGLRKAIKSKYDAGVSYVGKLAEVGRLGTHHAVVHRLAVSGLDVATCSQLTEAINSRGSLVRDFRSFVILFTFADLLELSPSVFDLLKREYMGSVVLVFAPASQVAIVSKILQDWEMIENVGAEFVKHGTLKRAVRTMVTDLSKICRDKLIPAAFFLGDDV
ncbi:hypothetical protein FVE85_2926 [Porphyridium purpureum]|uniref:Uncharacterized protein n=1 Tax=Porphyridium purpureum TaxID=35688 RepID=A0A5J4YTX3_PORPP|nr:hypothetical protein FVE85_2926 [Porphyridium purpureum]|eukprot:POR6803..scf227_4